MAHARNLVVIAAAAWFYGGSAAVAHSWYPASCCGGQDCRELAEDNGETATETPGGWQLWDGRLVPRGIVRPSLDMKFHVCESKAGIVLCFFAPPGAT